MPNLISPLRNVLTLPAMRPSEYRPWRAGQGTGQNLIPWSDDYTRWTASGVIVTPDADQGQTKLTAENGAAFASIRPAADTVTIPAGTRMTFSVYCRAGENNLIRPGMVGNDWVFGVSPIVLFDLAVLQFVQVSASVTARGFEPQQDGSVRLWITSETTADQGVRPVIFTPGPGTLPSTPGDGVSGIYVGGAQLEIGDLSDYKPTAGA